MSQMTEAELKIENKRLRDALCDSVEALESIWAAIGDALMSGKGIVKPYSQRVASKAYHASEKARDIIGWKQASLEDFGG